MSTPEEIVPAVAEPPPAIPPPVVAPEQPADGDAELRSLVAEIVKATSLGFDPTTILKGTVTVIAIADPPTLTVNISGDTTTAVSSVRYLDSYSPTVGDTVLLGKQGSDLFALGRIAIRNDASTGWIQPTLNSGFTHNGDGQGNVMYRRVWDNGTWKVQFKGACGRTANTQAFTLPVDYRPVQDVKLITSRGFAGGSVAIQIWIGADGIVSPVEGGSVALDTGGSSANTSAASPNTDTVDPIDNTTATTVGDHGSHGHGVIGGHWHNVDSHWHNGNGHTHSRDITYPDWISFHGVEFFLS